MIHKPLIILISSLFLFSCNFNKHNPNIQELRKNQIKNALNQSGFIKLPLIFNAIEDDALKANYNVDFMGNDTLIFDSDIYSIIGFLPDTSNFYAVLFHTVGDMLYPTIITMDKDGKKIDRQIICAAECAGHGEIDIVSCYDSVLITKNLEIHTNSKLIGKIETEDSIPHTIDICNIRKVDGFIDNKGTIKLKNTDLEDCN